MKAFSTLFYLVICAASVGFILLNSDKITVDYYWGKVVWSSGIAIVVGFLVGLVLGNFFGSLKGRLAMKRKMMNKFQATLNSAPSTPPNAK